MSKPDMISVSVDRIEVLSARVERFDATDIPDWAISPGFSGVELYAAPPSQVGVALDFVARRDDVAVAVSLTVTYDVTVNGKTTDQIEQEIKTLSQEAATTLVNRGLADAAPYIRELVYSLSGRVDPDGPIFMQGGPGRASVPANQ